MAHGPDTEQLLKLISEMRYGELAINFMRVTSLPELPRGLRKLTCHTTDITSLPTLPDSLEQIVLNYCPLTSLPELPPKLMYLDIGHTQVRTLPRLPRTLRILMVRNSPVASLPELPDSLEILYCMNLDIEEIPYMPHRLFISVSDCPNLRIQKGSWETTIDYSERWSRSRVQRRHRDLKEELIAEFWKPERLEKMLETGGWALVESY